MEKPSISEGCTSGVNCTLWVSRYPDIQDEIEIARGKSMRVRPQEIRPVLAAQELLALQNLVERVFIHDNIYKYIVRLVDATRNNVSAKAGSIFMVTRRLFFS